MDIARPLDRRRHVRGHAKTSVEQVNRVFGEEAKTPGYDGVVRVTNDPLAPSDIIGGSAAIVDREMTMRRYFACCHPSYFASHPSVSTNALSATASTSWRSPRSRTSSCPAGSSATFSGSRSRTCPLRV